MALELDFDLDLLSGMPCGVSGEKIMGVNCVGLVILFALYCGILNRGYYFFPFLFILLLFG